MITIKQYLMHVVRTLSGENKRQQINDLEESIEDATAQAQLHRYTEIYHYKMNHINSLQHRYMDLTGDFYPCGEYKSIRRKR